MSLIIEEKLKLNQIPICFFKEGMFLKVLNESFYIVQQHFKFNLKPQVKLIKKINQTVIIGGFPFDSIMTKFLDAQPTQFGYQLLGDYDLSGYNEWYANCCQRYKPKNQINISNNTQTANSIISETETIESQQHQKRKQQQLPVKILTEQQLAFLQLWQPNLYSQAIDTAFIKELKEHLLS